MPPRQRIAVTIPAGPKLQDTIDLVKWAEANGYEDGWMSDSGPPDSLTMMAALAAHAPTLRLGIAVVPVYSRTPAVLAATANTLGQLMPGRVVLGLGSSSQTIMDQWHGVPMKKPLTRVKETTIMVRSMLAGEKSNFDLSTLYSKGYSQAPLEEEVPIYLAALRPKMIEMAAEIGDGVIFNMWPKEALPKMIEHVHIGAERAGKDPNEVEVVNRYLVLVTDDKEAAVEAFRARMAPYYATPVYNDFLAWAGYADVAETISEGWAERDREKTMGALSFDLANEIAVIGTADECRERIRWAGETGIHTHIIAPLPAAAEDVQRTFEAFTPENFPR
ncbi:MAG: LLM class flavin-dependent oxidoreductase [Rhodospirillaceae bacterium]|jgi:probable F420-dependent oxidoreductase|nr:LLM class flavin-dependent oxidoreductase [Rhodospirillaceae bacterium]MBT4045084.1 LLM class flavin-dependent oxidoreductase [Rhodospirillaceae bacterium]MBT4686554.1 LLM class flavin-dependent oxidoreductase [Rhodospirillaceae bacterium]MBT5082696.1 LLM class flavin-dependent oxidoreductase [Rhodospirillaceae bacterium]MBT5524140.1 LLM class flavin-dependent oxidoreductase [Rhodospirillaceae bacterium]